MNTSVGSPLLHRAALRNYIVKDHPELNRNNLVETVFKVLENAFNRLNKIGADTFEDRDRHVYYLLN